MKSLVPYVTFLTTLLAIAGRGLLRDEAQERLNEVPFRVITLARPFVNPVAWTEFELIWLADIAKIDREEQRRPITRILRRLGYSISMLRGVVKSGRHFAEAVGEPDVDDRPFNSHYGPQRLLHAATCGLATIALAWFDAKRAKPGAALILAFLLSTLCLLAFSAIRDLIRIAIATTALTSFGVIALLLRDVFTVEEFSASKVGVAVLFALMVVVFLHTWILGSRARLLAATAGCLVVGSAIFGELSTGVVVGLTSTLVSLTRACADSWFASGIMATCRRVLVTYACAVIGAAAGLAVAVLSWMVQTAPAYVDPSAPALLAFTLSMVVGIFFASRMVAGMSRETTGAVFRKVAWTVTRIVVLGFIIALVITVAMDPAEVGVESMQGVATLGAVATLTAMPADAALRRLAVQLIVNVASACAAPFVVSGLIAITSIDVARSTATVGFVSLVIFIGWRLLKRQHLTIGAPKVAELS